MQRSDSYEVVEAKPLMPSRPADLDAFYTDMHSYWRGRGMFTIVIQTLCEVLKTFVVLLLIITFVFRVNWEDLMRCHAEACASVSWTLPLWRQPPGFIYLMVFILVVYLAAQLWYTQSHLRRMRVCREYYVRVLRIPDADLPYLSWSATASTLAAANEQEKFSVLPVDELSIAMRILRFENYMVALLSEKNDTYARLLNKCVRMTQALEWVTKRILRRAIDKTTFRLRPKADIIRDMTWDCTFLGVCGIVLVLPIVFYTIITSLLRYGVELKTEPGSIGLRRWSTYAKWCCRDYNELPDVLETRLKDAFPVVEEFRSHMDNETYNQVCRLVLFLSSAVAVCMTGLSILNPALLTQIIIVGELNLLWFLSVAVMVATAARACQDPGVKAGVIRDPHGAFKRVEDCLHHMLGKNPVTSSHRGGDPSSSTQPLAELESSLSWNYHTASVLYFFQELFGILTMPFILLGPMNHAVPAIVDDIFALSTDDDRCGSCCSFSTFDFTKYGSRRYGADQEGTSYLRSKNEKMEISYINFLKSHPEWDGGADRQNIMPPRSHTLSGTTIDSSAPTSPTQYGQLSVSRAIPAVNIPKLNLRGFAIPMASTRGDGSGGEQSAHPRDHMYFSLVMDHAASQEFEMQEDV